MLKLQILEQNLEDSFVACSHANLVHLYLEQNLEDNFAVCSHANLVQFYLERIV
jgi:hypothetical protein